MAESNFVDYVKIYCRSGKGGAGSKHFFRDKRNPRGGPDGGDGGRGGHVILKGNDQLWTLLHLKYRRHIYAGNGQNGGANRRSGHSGEDVVIEVPRGTVVQVEGSDGPVEVNDHNEEKVLMEGGRGGLGNDHFKSATNQSPRYAQPGEMGMEAYCTFELKLLADVGLVGFPNAGKSTLLAAVSAAKPEIGDYPFTTLVPNLGIVSYRENRSFVMADIPGIIEGAHEGKGLGIRFLRHIERNSVLLFLIPVDSKDIRKEYSTLLHELHSYNTELLDKGKVLAITKSDLADDELIAALLEELPGDLPAICISSQTGHHLMELKDLLWNEMNR